MSLLLLAVLLLAVMGASALWEDDGFGKNGVAAVDPVEDGGGEGGEGAARVAINVLNASPPLVHLPAFLTPDECDALIALADNRLEPAEVLNQGETVRTSESMWLTLEELGEEPFRGVRAKIVAALEQLEPDFGFVHPDFHERLQVQRYGVGQLYAQHWDANSNTPGYDRRATVLMYLTTVPKGGETIFPYIVHTADGLAVDENKLSCDQVVCNPEIGDVELNQEAMYCCCAEIFRMPPVRGDGFIFYPSHEDGQVDRRMLHASCPVAPLRPGDAGEQPIKYVAQLWFHVNPPPVPNEDL